MNCTDSVLNSDELPERGIDQCPSALIAHTEAQALSSLNGTGCWLFSKRPDYICVLLEQKAF